MQNLDTLMDHLRASGDAAAKQEKAIAQIATAMSIKQRQLKTRKKLLWLDADLRQLNPAIDGKNAETREAQHAAVCEADHEVRKLREDLDRDAATLAALRAALSTTRREIQIIETELATVRAELHARAAQAFGKIAAADGAGLVGAAS